MIEPTSSDIRTATIRECADLLLQLTPKAWTTTGVLLEAHAAIIGLQSSPPKCTISDVSEKPSGGVVGNHHDTPKEGYDYFLIGTEWAACRCAEIARESWKPGKPQYGLKISDRILAEFGMEEDR